MAQLILNGILRDNISPDILFKWISRSNRHSDESAEFYQFPCTVGDFISHFLNYVHEDAPSFDENTNKTNFTLKNSTDQNNSDQGLNLKKRPVSSGEVKNDPNIYFETFPVLTSKCSNDPNKHNFNGDFKSFGTTTPKLIKRNSDIMHENSYASPISPLYVQNNSTPKNRSLLKSSEKSFCLGDFIVQKRSSGKKKVQRSLCEVTNMQNDNPESRKYRRINPTNLNEKRFSCGFKESENSFNFKNHFVELPVDNLNEQRNLLAEERLKIKNNFDDLIRAPNIMKLQTFNSKIEISAVPEKVTFIHQLDNLVKIYVFLLNNNYILNIASELHFLISLLLSKQYLSEELNDSDTDIQMILEDIENEKDLFKTVHNCVYFAVNILELQTTILRILDRPTLKMLHENERIKLFSERFHGILLSIYNNKLEQTRETIEIVHRNVCFMSDTDNRENFVVDASFHAFRKQRDLFYEILRIWEQNHFLPGWNFAIALSGKIKTLLNLYNDPVNYRHFARLFKMQLLTTCRQNTNDETISEQQASLVASLPNIDADKLLRLKNRLTTKQENNDLNSAPTFTGNQEFYKDFILVSGSHIFYEHLKDSLILEITQLLSDTFDGLLDNEENDCSVNIVTRNSYFTSLKFLRIVAKFLGFLDSLPYKTDFKFGSDKVLKVEINTRRWLQPSFDFESIILNSLKRKTLVFTIPWVSKYLSMLDYVTIRLPYFEKILNILFYIYYSTHTESKETPLIYNKILIRLSLGWLFELPHFPSELYFNWISKLPDVDASNSLYLNLTNLAIEHGGMSANSVRGLSLDDLKIVDQTILYTFCPYLECFRKLLTANSSNTGNVIKHITPLSAVDNLTDIAEKKLKCQLEDAFFNCQPVSVRKTVEFISERVASSCVKHICNNIVPEFKKSSLEEAKRILREFVANCDFESDDEGKLEAVVKQKIHELTSQYLKQIQEICTIESDKLTSDRIATSIDALLAVDELEQTKKTCVTITKRLCMDRVQQWANSHINIGLFNKFKTLSKEAMKILDHPERDLKEKTVFQLPSGGRNTNHNSQTLNAVKIVDIIRNISLDVIESKAIQSDCIADLLRSTEKTILERCDVNDQIICLINRMLVDLILLLLTHKIEYFDDNLPLFINHWKNFNQTTDLFKTLICSRNVMVIGQANNVSKSWSYLAKFIIEILKQELLSYENFEQQCIAVYQQDWDKTSLKALSTCIQDVVDGINIRGPNSNRFDKLLRLMSPYCSKMDF